jgi:hypothetical protein
MASTDLASRLHRSFVVIPCFPTPRERIRLAARLRSGKKKISAYPSERVARAIMRRKKSLGRPRSMM